MDKNLWAALKAINAIDDFFEYQYDSCTKEQIKEEVMRNIEFFVDELQKEGKEELNDKHSESGKTDTISSNN